VKENCARRFLLHREKVKLFAQRKLKGNIRLGKYLNQHLWERGIRHPPHQVAVTASEAKDKDKTVFTIELVGAPKEMPLEQPKKGLAERLKETLIKEEAPPEGKTPQEKQEGFTKKEEEQILEQELPKAHQKKRANIKPETKEMGEKQRKESIVQAPRKKRGDATHK